MRKYTLMKRKTQVEPPKIFNTVSLLSACWEDFRSDDIYSRLLPLLLTLCIAALPEPAAAQDSYIHHDLTVRLEISSHRLIVTDTITYPGKQREPRFVLHAGLEPFSPDPNVHIDKKTTRQGSVPIESFIATLPKGVNSFTIQYAGVIYHPAESNGKIQDRGFDMTPGEIAEEGVYLAGSSAWYPQFDTDLITFSLNVELAATWDAVSQGSRTKYERTHSLRTARWESSEPQQEIFLVASPFTSYEKTFGNFTAMAFLRTPDAVLAGKYLDATNHYITMYDQLIGLYPYRKFALVENFMETGLGMPSFTLLGPTVLRLPFIINTSYPHEILHNWWGNSVYPVYELGNWSEGITAYLADHMLQEQQGQGQDYRLASLQKYTDYVSRSKDFPLVKFTSRHNPATEAVGYGKSLMLFHMMRLELGDPIFITAIRDFYRKYKFRFATFDDLEKCFESASKKDLKADYYQWVTRTGAPKLRLSDAKAVKHDNLYTVTATLEQVQSGKSYSLHVPIAITLAEQEHAYQTVIGMSTKKRHLKIDVPAEPLRLDIDPESDIFRRLDRDEIPPAVTQALGAKKMLVLLPASVEQKVFDAYRKFAEMLTHAGPDAVDVMLDRDVKQLPTDCAVTILGWENSYFEKELSSWRGYELVFTKTNVTILGTEIARSNHAFVLTTRNPENKDMAFMFIAVDRLQSLSGLARKLPHYHKYSYLAFEGDEPRNISKGRWPVFDSPMTAFLREKDRDMPHVMMGKLAPRKALASPVSFRDTHDGNHESNASNKVEGLSGNH